MKQYIRNFSAKAEEALRNLPDEEIAKALNILQAAYERDGRIYVFGNGGSMAIATHWVADFNKTVFDSNLDKHHRRFQAIRLPSTESEITAWANDIGFDMIFAGPLQNYLQDSDAIIAISSSGNSSNVIKAVELAKARHVPVIGVSGFDAGNKLNQLADAKIYVPAETGNYFLVEGIHGVILHMMIKYFKDYFNHLADHSA
ncbi:MAG: SIS domain-containing protein [Candidatus Liptonbacteria bacterium]|nr:SIS domain-containing protein [Candidatus Liptonbacteria bacterium]